MDPFFIVGAPRSGTTLLRDLFKQINDVYSPEETHFFRWSCPFRGNEYRFVYDRNKVLAKHRRMDEISDEEFAKLVSMSFTKRDLNDLYCERVARKRGKKYWFEKTPQNVYGLPLICDLYPEARIIHIVRHPYAVVKSLMIGKVLKVDDVIGAANYWYESVAIVNVLKPILKERLIEIKYENLSKYPDDVFKDLCLNLSIEQNTINTKSVKESSDDYNNFFSESDISSIKNVCQRYMALYNYN